MTEKQKNTELAVQDNIEISERDTFSSEEVYELPENQAKRSMLWSVLSLVLGISAVLVCQVWWLGIILSLCSLGLALFARYRLGFFDKVALFGLIFSIIGAVFGIFSAVISISGIFDKLV